MKRFPGFSLIELMVAMAIAGILAGVAVPNVQRWQAKSKFQSQTKQIFQMLDSARNNAISEKKCLSDALSIGWKFEITSDEMRVVKLSCDNGTDPEEIVEEFTFDPFIEIVNNSIAIPWSKDLAMENAVTIYFFSGSVTPKINDEFSNESVKVPITSSTTLKKTLCLHRVSGIPSLTENENCE